MTATFIYALGLNSGMKLMILANKILKSRKGDEDSSGLWSPAGLIIVGTVLVLGFFIIAKIIGILD
ncbi:MAG: hypothetical protein QS98_C0006G0033 [archaeon GW2011_AR3]|nr:MAG: hypothetical protein QS98_C0006G0033 [archaeon GW2011_AR3]